LAAAQESDDEPVDLVKISEELAKPFALLMVLIASIILRPWDYIPGLSSIKPVTLMILSTSGLVLLSGTKLRFFSIPLSRVLLTLWLTMIFTTPFSIWIAPSATLAITLAQYLLLFALIGTIIVSTDALYRMTYVLVVTGLVLGLAAIKTGAMGPFLADGRIIGIGEGLLSDPNDLAHILVIIAPLTWWALVSMKGLLVRGAIAGSLLLIMAGMVTTQSRGGLLSLLAAGAVFFVLSRESIAKKLSLVVLALILAVAALPSNITERYASIGTAARTDESSQARLAVWRAGGQMFVDHLFTGVGLGNFEDAYGSMYIDRQGAGKVWRSAHNSVVEVAGELGIVGVSSWLLFTLSPFILLWRARKSMLEIDDFTPDDERLTLWLEVMMASMTGFFVGAMFLSKAFEILVPLVVAAAVVGSVMGHRWSEARINGVQPTP